MRCVRLSCAFVTGLLLALGSAAFGQTVVSFTPDLDNTLYEDAAGNFSNALGPDIFAGMTGAESRRRALIRFPVDSIPAGSTITNVQVRLTLNKARSGTYDVSLHRALSSWGEGTSRDTASTGQGTFSTTGDATWIHTFFANQFWTTPGGDFVAQPSSTRAVPFATGDYLWTGPGLIADVQQWVNTPTSNKGWMVVGTENQTSTARRFYSREGSRPPLVTITYTNTTSPTGACCLPSGVCVILTSQVCVAQGGVYQGNNSTCTPNNCPQPQGACCVEERACLVVTQAECLAMNGVYLGNNTTCTANLCYPILFSSIGAQKDNTLYETTDVPISNGAGQGFFSGMTNVPTPLRRRGVIRFNLASIPARAIVTDSRLRLFMSYTEVSGPGPISLHRATTSWGQGTSDALAKETAGAAPTPQDATWVHRFFPGTTWATPGGDFVPQASSTITLGVTANEWYEWTGNGVIADVQNWISGGLNEGWLLKSNETTPNSLRRFESSEGLTPSTRPELQITYFVPDPTGACCMPDGMCAIQTQLECSLMGGTYQGNATVCSPNPCPQPTGACCLANASCVEITEHDCMMQGGIYHGNGSMCSMTSCPLVLTPYVDALPRPAVATPTTGTAGGAAHYDMPITEQFQQLHRDLPATRVWGYAGTYPGPTIEARRDLPVTVRWINNLRVAETGVLRTTHPLPVDTCLHGPDMTGEVPVTVTHLHGGHVPAASDGYPELSFAPGFQSDIYDYPNIQPASTIWYHDHALGITRLNVYMGLAGFYLIRDAAEDALNLPRGTYEVPLAIQDRSFNPDGSLRYLDMWMEHFFGDVAVVNGKVWPFLNVDKGKYRFRLLNGSTSRTYTLALDNGATFWQISTDQGLLGEPLALTTLTIQPGERADVVIDFAPYATGTQIVLTNSAPSPFPSGGMGPDLPNIMKFIVGANPGDTDALPTTLVPVVPIPQSESVMQRDFMLERMGDSHCPGHTDGMWMINGLGWDEITERPVLGTTEIWAWINRSGVTHPMHMHLVAFQVLDRQAFTIVSGEPVPTGPLIPPLASEMGWKDTVQSPPGMITRVIARFETFAGRFAYHCHILEHEDHEMMRQFETCWAPSFTQQPLDAATCIGASATFIASSAGSGVTFRWQRNGVDLSDGPTPSGSMISGSNTSVLVITGIAQADAGTYTCVATNTCASTSSINAALTIGECVPCPADFNQDGGVDGSDIEAFFLTWETGSPLADVNQDGGTDGADIETFFVAWEAGGCG
jgi:spore coat protein A